MTIITMLGLDPSLTNTGYAIADVEIETARIATVHRVGLIETKPGQSGKKVRKSSEDMERTRQIVTGLKDAVALFKIKIACAEIPTGTQSARGAFSNGVCVGVMASLPYPLFEVSPTEVKLASHGTKHADKEDIVRWAVEIAGAGQAWPIHGAKNDWEIPYGKPGKFITKKAEHPADALAAIAAGIKTPQFAQLAGVIQSLRA